LPWRVAEENASVQIVTDDLGPGLRPDQKRSGRVLIVEDTHTVASLMKEYLENKGYEVYMAHNGLEGLNLAKKQLPDLILMDVMMPVMDGMEATRQIRADKSLENVPVIALTALAMPGDRERCFAAGMTDYLSKPIQFKELLKVMDRHTALAKSEKQ
jgi:CheY-like chemotaxis protein